MQSDSTSISSKENSPTPPRTSRRGNPSYSGVEVNNNEVLAIDDLSYVILYDDQEATQPTRKEGVTENVEDPQD